MSQKFMLTAVFISAREYDKKDKETKEPNGEKGYMAEIAIYEPNPTGFEKSVKMMTAFMDSKPLDCNFGDIVYVECGLRDAYNKETKRTTTEFAPQNIVKILVQSPIISALEKLEKGGKN